MDMALFAAGERRVTDELFLTAGKAIAEQVSEENLAEELIYPPRERIFAASLHVAERVAACIFDQGLARVPRPADVGALIRSRVYRPVYLVRGQFAPTTKEPRIMISIGDQLCTNMLIFVLI